MHFALTLEGLESAFAAADRVNNTTIDHIRYKCKTDQALLMQYVSLKPRNVLEPMDLKANVAYSPAPAPAPAFHQINHDSVNNQPVIPSVPSMIHFSTYGSSANSERAYSSEPASSSYSFLSVRSNERLINSPVMYSESTSMTRILSSR